MSQFYSKLSFKNSFNRWFFATANDGVNVSGLKELLAKVNQNLTTILGVLLGAVGLATLIMSIVWVAKAGFANNENNRKTAIRALIGLWIAVGVILLLWGLKEAIFQLIQIQNN